MGMSIVVKKIGGKEYAYHAYRVGNKVIQKYLGPASSPSAAARKAGVEERKKVPARFHPLFWDVKPRDIDVRQHATYIIERVFELGNLDALLWLQRVYPTALLLETLEVSKKLSPRSRNFWEIWFGVAHAY